MAVYIVYRVKRDDNNFKDIWNIYDNELEALRECNCWNSDKGVYFFYTNAKDVLKVFEV